MYNPNISTIFVYVVLLVKEVRGYLTLQPSNLLTGTFYAFFLSSCGQVLCPVADLTIRYILSSTKSILCHSGSSYCSQRELERRIEKEEGGISLLMVPLTGYRNGKIVNCLFLKITINVRLAQCSPNCCF